MDLSDAKTVSPLLDEFSLGKPFSSHNGITCCPAIHTVTKEKFILKKISVPESQIQVDAMLLTGACANREAAQAYYEDITKGLEREIELQKSLSRSRGFAPVFGYQSTPKENGEVGMDLWVLSAYGTTLASYMKRNTMTHLGAVNLGIDLCAALTICRKAGYLYQDLKPENIFITSQRQYQLGDLGFLSLEELSYATFPERYRSVYTAPELFDDFAELNATMDIYALGMVLYRIYNGGQGPFDDLEPQEAEARRLAGEQLPPPKYADYEMAEILLKAAAFKPADRWQSPEEMGQALVSYMQRNPVNDAMIAPPIVTDPVLDAAAAAIDDRATREDAPEESREQAPEEAAPQETDLPGEEPQEEIREEPAREEPVESAPEAPHEEPDEEAREASAELYADETLPGEEDLGDGVADQELADILQRAEAFLELETPAEEPPREPETPEEDPGRQEGESGLFPVQKPSFKKPLIVLAVLAILAVLAGGGYWFYSGYYCVPVESFTVAEGSVDSMTVELSTQADPQSLRLSCQDTYGNTYSGSLENGRATFTGLNPNTQYTVTVSIEGFHKLTGTTQVSYTTGVLTEIQNFTAVTGGEDGSVNLSFEVNGPEPAAWTLEYEAGDGSLQTRSFTGHTITLTGLTTGQSYTFRLTAGEEYYLTGTQSVTFTAGAVVMAQNLTITGMTETGFTVSWDEPESPVDVWTVNCSGGETNETQTVSGCSATFENVDLSVSHSIRVTAQGMSESAQFSMTANPVFIQSVTTDTTVPGTMTVSWSFTGKAPAGWVLLYAFGEGETESMSVETTEPTAVIDQVMPGTAYTFRFQTTDGTTVFQGQTFQAAAPEAVPFEGFGLTAEELTIGTFPAPEGEDWSSTDLDNVVQTGTFSLDDRIGYLLAAPSNVDDEDTEVTILEVLRDESGAVVDYSSRTMSWTDMWQGKLFVGELKQTPAEPGTYTLELYFDGQLVQTAPLTIQ